MKLSRPGLHVIIMVMQCILLHKSRLSQEPAKSLPSWLKTQSYASCPSIDKVHKALQTFQDTQNSHILNSIRLFITMTTEVHEKYNGYKCPRHSVIKKMDGYDERIYERSKWVSTMANCDMYGRSSFPVFKRLLNYISGGNETSVKIPMTVPVLSKVQGPVEEAKADDYEMSFFLGQENETFNAPVKDDVYLQTVPPINVYCMQYGGYNGSGATKEHLKKLRTALDKDGLGGTYHPDVYYSAGYDSPWKLFGRRNEVWLLKKEAN